MSRRLRAPLFAGASLGVLLGAAGAFAQEATPDATGLEEVVVTATRQADTVNRVPLSVAAVTQQTLDQQGIKQAQDITRLVPGLNVVNGSSSPGVGTFSIRGIVGGTGAATTGVYLDDTSLTKRANNGVSQNNGAPLPILFDLERIEVLKGPQGTLYGGSSQGGTIRFITPTPSLTTYSGALRLEGKTVKLGEAGYEVGAAVGGPIVQDKLGFRVSAMRRKTPGYIDAYSPYGENGSPGTTLIKKDANAVTDEVLRASLLWQVNDRGSIMLSTYNSRTVTEGGPDTVTDVYSKSADGARASATETFTTPSVCINTQTRNLTTQPILDYDPSIALGTGPAGTAVLPSGCTASTPASARFVRPSYTYGPFPQGRDIAYKTTDQELNPSETRLDVQTLTMNYDFDHMNVKSITSFVHDVSFSRNAGGEDQVQQQSIVGGPVFGTTSVAGNPAGAVRGFPLWAANPDYPGLFTASSRRNGLEQELRFSSAGDQRPLSWVAGIFYQVQNIHQLYYYADRGLNASELSFFGVTAEQRYGIQNVCDCDTFLEANIHDDEIAAFAEANYWLTDKLKLTGGIRFSRIGFRFQQLNHGMFAARYPNSAASLVTGSTTDSPTTPKISLTYQFTPDDLVYVTAAKGFRAGGANSPVTQSVCQTALDAYGIASTDVPTTFAPDSVWSYEAGGKFRLLDNRLQLNGAVYRIDWSGVQSTVTLSCGLSFVINGGRARSEGVDLQAQFRPIRPLTLGLNIGYTNARYIDAVSGPRGPGIGQPSINAGDHFNIPPWQVSASANYDFDVFGRSAYVRGDYQWQSEYTGLGSYGVASYNPFTRKVGARDLVNARVGVRFDALEINLFSNNLLDSKDKVGNAGNGKSACTTAGGAGCAVYSTFNPFVSQSYLRPREIGIQANYRF